MIDITNANEYFAAGKHSQSAAWSAFTQPQREAALLHARRLIARELGRALVDTEAAYVEGDVARDEYAVYEQSLFMLRNMPVSNGQGTLPAWVGTEVEADTEAQRARNRNPSAISPEARKWMRNRTVYTQVKLVRG